MKVLIGKLTPTRGTIERHSRLRLGYFDQHSVEKLSSGVIAKSSPVEHFVETMKNEYGIETLEGPARGILGRFGLDGRKAIDPIGLLSGGQKVSTITAVVDPTLHSSADVHRERIESTDSINIGLGPPCLGHDRIRNP